MPVKFVDTDSISYEDGDPIYYPGERVVAFGDIGECRGMVGDGHVDIYFHVTGTVERVSLGKVRHA
jgi:hypothetical protein